VLVNIGNSDGLKQYDGKAIALSVTDHHAIFPAVFLIHEGIVRASNPFCSGNLDGMTDPIQWPDWIKKYVDSDGALSHTSVPGAARNDSTKVVGHASDSGNGNPAGTNGTNFTSHSENEGQSSTVPLPNFSFIDPKEVVAIVAATRGSYSWQTCKMEGEDWSGTAEQNIRKYNEKFAASSAGN
jgi:hypothetical protein